MAAQLEEKQLENRQQKICGQKYRLMAKLDELVNQHEIIWVWVKGHAGHPENERVDKLARTAALSFKKLTIPKMPPFNLKAVGFFYPTTF